MDTVDQIMTRQVHTIGESESLSKAAKLMSERGIRHMVVVDAEGKPLGVFSERDVLRYLVRSLNQAQSRPKDAPASTLASKPMVSVRPGSSIAEAASLMAEMRIGCVPVLDDNGDLAGIVSAVDVLRYTASLGRDEADVKEQQPAHA